MHAPNVQDEPRPWLARLVLLGARDVTAMVVGSGALLGSEVFGPQSSVPSDTGQHSRTDLVAIVKRKDEISPAITRKDFMRAALTLNPPTNSKERSKDCSCLPRTPDTHAATVKT
jgi:hypothetical protein